MNGVDDLLPPLLDLSHSKQRPFLSHTILPRAIFRLGYELTATSFGRGVLDNHLSDADQLALSQLPPRRKECVVPLSPLAWVF
jgi:hypothetical protein